MIIKLRTNLPLFKLSQYRVALTAAKLYPTAQVTKVVNRISPKQGKPDLLTFLLYSFIFETITLG